MKKIRRILILGNGKKPRIKKFSEYIHHLIKPMVQSVRIELDNTKDLSRTNVDCMIILGGDGAILSTAARMGRNQTPSIGVQMGRFGFLSQLTPEDCEASLEKVIKGQGKIHPRMMLSCKVRHERKTVFRSLALNDAVVASGSVSRMVMVALEIDGDYVTTYHGDGVIVSTPVGSTAHSLSAGGGIMEPSLRAIGITPICSHALTIRPLVLPDKRSIRLKPDGSRNALSLTLDGQRVHKLSPNEEVVIEAAPHSFQLIKLEGRTYFETLRQKFNWGGNIFKDPQLDKRSKDSGKRS